MWILNWKWTWATTDGVSQVHKNTSTDKNAYWETALVFLFPDYHFVHLCLFNLLISPSFCLVLIALAFLSFFVLSTSCKEVVFSYFSNVNLLKTLLIWLSASFKLLPRQPVTDSTITYIFLIIIISKCISFLRFTWLDHIIFLKTFLQNCIN